MILLSEYHKLNNSFYVGSNAFQDGYLMGKQFLSHYADRKLILISLQNDNNVHRRISGFYHAIKEVQPKLIEQSLDIKLDSNMFKDLKLLPSKLASLLAEVIKGDEQLCIYSPMGIPQLPLALMKAKLAKQAVCLCHDCYIEHSNEYKNVNMGFTITCNQDIRRQGDVTIKLATKFVKDNLYPEQKKIYIPSVFNV